MDDVLSLMELLSVHLTAILKKLHSCSPDLADELDAWECSAAKTAGLAVAINDLGAGKTLDQLCPVGCTGDLGSLDFG